MIPAKEAEGWCIDGKCSALTYKTRVYDVGARPWLLPYIIALAENEDDRKRLVVLAAAMTRPFPDQRPSFSELLATLPRSETKGGGQS